MKIEIKVFKQYVGLCAILLASLALGGSDKHCPNSPDPDVIEYGFQECSNNPPVIHPHLPQANTTKGSPMPSTHFVFEMKNDEFFTHPVSDFSSQTYFGSEYASIYAMAFDQSANVLYGLENKNKELVTINQATGALTVVGLLTNFISGDYVSGLDITPDGSCYVISLNGYESTLYTCDLSTGALTVVGTQSTAPSIVGIAMDCDGNIYGHDNYHDSMYSLNPLTGAATLIGPTGLNANGAQDITYDRQQKILYGYIYTGGSQTTYGSINVLTGAVTPLVAASPTGEFSGASKTSCFPDLIFKDGFDNSDIIFSDGFE